MPIVSFKAALISLFCLILTSAGWAQQPAGFTVPADVGFRQATISSEGTRTAAEVFWPAQNADKKLPTIIMAHGWGGTAALLRADAIVFAKAGYFVVTFDYRGWGASDGRVIIADPAPADHPKDGFPATVKEVREVVDPLDQAADWFNAIHWVQGEAQADPERIGLWGSSFSGGLVVYVAARDKRVKAVHSQVGSLDPRGGDRADTYAEATKRARGEISYPPPGVRVGGLRGAPIRHRFLAYAPVDDINLAPDCAVQFVLAENEELFDNRTQGIKAYNDFKGAKKNLVIVPGITHYGIYGPARPQAQKLAVDWFDKYLKP